MTALTSNLEDAIVKVLKAEGHELTIPQIEQRLASEQPRLDTFDVRDAVWRLISMGLAQFTPRRYVKATGK